MLNETKNTGLLVFAALLLILTGQASQCNAGVNVDVGDEGVHVTVGPEGVHVTVRDNLPAIRFASPPELVVIPGTYIYMVPDNDVDVLYFQDYCWRPYEGHWYRSQEYNGQWSYVEPGKIPGGLRSLPMDYRHRLSAEYKRISYEDVKRNWIRWEKEKYWDRRDREEQGEYDHGRKSEHDHEGR